LFQSIWPLFTKLNDGNDTLLHIATCNPTLLSGRNLLQLALSAFGKSSTRKQAYDIEQNLLLSKAQNRDSSGLSFPDLIDSGHASAKSLLISKAELAERGQTPIPLTSPMQWH